MTFLLDGKIASQSIKEQLKMTISHYTSQGLPQPVLAIIRLPNDDASSVYLSARRNWANYVGIQLVEWSIPISCNQMELLAQIEQFNCDDSIDGIMIDHPLPSTFDEPALVNAIHPSKDIDGMTPYNAGKMFQNGTGFVPNTARGVMELLTYYKVELTAKHVVVVGRSNTVGRPLSQLLLHRNATVTVVHSKTADLKKWTQQADILIVAMGKKHFITKDYIKSDTIVIDVGIHYDDQGHVTGDVHPEVKELVHMISPVPGGVGPMTTLSLMMNVVDAYISRRK